MSSSKPHPSEALPFDSEDINPVLEQRHRDVMLDLVLTWATLDGALGMMLSRGLGIPMSEGADAIGRLPSSQKFEELREQLSKAPDGQEAAQLIRRHKKQYERHSRVRNHITHSNCVGFWTVDPEYVVFLKFERADGDDLAVDRVPLEVMLRAIKWGRAMKDVALQIADVPYKDSTHAK